MVVVPGRGEDRILDHHRYAHFYAVAQDGVWWGDTVDPGVYVTNHRLSDCIAIGHSAPWRVMHMSELNVGWPPSAPGTHTVNLNA